MNTKAPVAASRWLGSSLAGRQSSTMEACARSGAGDPADPCSPGVQSPSVTVSGAARRPGGPMQPRGPGVTRHRASRGGNASRARAGACVSTSLDLGRAELGLRLQTNSSPAALLRQNRIAHSYQWMRKYTPSIKVNFRRKPSTQNPEMPRSKGARQAVVIVRESSFKNDALADNEQCNQKRLSKRKECVPPSACFQNRYGISTL